MRLQLLTVLMLFALLVLAACSSMEVDSAGESFGNQMPTDFDWQVFDRLNPEVRLAQAPDYFSRINAEWIAQKREEEGLTTSQVTSRYLTPYRNASIVWGAAFNAACLETGNPCCDNTDGIYADSVGISILIAQKYLKWPDKMICDMKGSSELKGYLNRLLLYGRQGEEINVIDSLITSIDSTIFYKTYILYGRERGMAYRICRLDELLVSRNSLVKRDYEYAAGGSIKEICNDPQPSDSKVTCDNNCVCNYSAYEFCAEDETTNPLTLYAIPEKK